MDRAKKKSLIVKFICLLLSSILWLYVSNVENPVRTSEIKGVPVEIVNSDVLSKSNLYITGNSNFTVDLKIEGAAKEIYRLNKSNFKLRVDLSEYALKKGENNVPVEVVSSPSGVTIKNSALLVVKINLEEGGEKTVKVYSKVATTYKNGISEKSISISPSSIKVSGPESLVNTVSSVVMRGQLSDISQNVSKNFSLVAVDSRGNEVEGVVLSQDKGKLNIEVGKEKEVKINPIYINKLPDDLTLENFSLSKDTVKVVGDAAVVDSIDKVDTLPIDLSTIKENKEVNIKLKLPDEVSLESEDSNITGYIQVKKKEDTNKKPDEVTTKKIEKVPVQLNDKGDGTLTFEPETITVEVSGKESELNKLTAENITASASVSNIKGAGEYEEPVKVSLTNTGSSVSIKTQPDKVKIIVK